MQRTLNKCNSVISLPCKGMKVIYNHLSWLSGLWPLTCPSDLWPYLWGTCLCHIQLLQEMHSVWWKGLWTLCCFLCKAAVPLCSCENADNGLCSFIITSWCFIISNDLNQSLMIFPLNQPDLILLYNTLEGQFWSRFFISCPPCILHKIT